MSRAIARSLHTSCILGSMSYIGRAPIALPLQVKVAKESTALQIEGPLGKTTIPTQPYVSLTQFDEEGKQFVAVAVEDDTVQNQREMWGTTRTLLSNAIEGVSVGFQQPVHLVGVGYRAVVEPNPRPAPGMSEQRLNLKLGFASQSSAFLPIPIGIDAKVPIPTRIELSGISKAAIGQFAANIRTLRKPEPYKGKGIFVGRETIKLKSAKKR